MKRVPDLLGAGVEDGDDAGVGDRVGGARLVGSELPARRSP
jgi:hypothetical protein